jgi:hypothetical protein
LADVLDERREGGVTKKSFNQATVAIILLDECGILGAEIITLLSLQSNLSFKLSNVFCDVVSSWSMTIA